jgi:hypothetical protein
MHTKKKHKIVTFIALSTDNMRETQINTRSSWDRKDFTAEWIALPDFVTLLDPDLDDNTRHGGADRARVTSGFLPRDGFYSRVLVFDRDSSDLDFVSTPNAHPRAEEKWVPPH